MPSIIVPLSLLGLVPFVMFGLAAVGHIPQTAEQALVGLIDYAAVILAFSGGVHWGLAQLPGSVRPSVRVGGRHTADAGRLGVAGAGADGCPDGCPQRAHPWLYCDGPDRTPRGAAVPGSGSRYVWIRWVFSTVAVMMMVTVLVLRLLGSDHCILTFFSRVPR